MPLCSQCHERPPGGHGQLCKVCVAEYMRGYRKISGGLKFRKGVDAMRTAAIRKFEQIGPGEMNGYTAAQILKTCEPES